MPSLASERERRIAQFAAQNGIDYPPRLVGPASSGPKVAFQTPQDVAAAHEILSKVQITRRESEHRTGLKRMLTSKHKPSEYKCREIGLALISVVNDNGPPGVVEVLVELLLAQGGDINLLPKSNSVWKRASKIDQEIKRTDLLLAATRVGNIDNIRLLVSHSDQTSLDQSLNAALHESPGERNLTIIEIILAKGANASSQDATFMSAVSADDMDLVALLFSAPKPVTTQFMSEGLLTAVQATSLQMVLLLAQSNADGNGGGGKALKAAVEAARHDLVTAVTFCKIPPSLESLDQAMPIIFSNETVDNERKKQLMEILLASGANGPGSHWCLIHITKLCISVPPPISADNTLISMLRLLISWKVSLEYESAEALKNVISSGRVDLIDTFLEAENFNSQLATTAFSAISPSGSPELTASIMSKLLAKGAYGNPLHEALISSVKTNHAEVVEMLVVRNEPNRASVDYNDAAALKDAVSREKIRLVKILLSGGPSTASVAKAFPGIWNCGREGRFTLAKELLLCGAEGYPVHNSLVSAVADHGATRDERLITLLVSKGADVNFQDGKAIELATKSFDMTVLDTLLLGDNIQAKSLNAAFTSAMALRPYANRFTACAKLINAGVVGDGVNEALAIAVTEDVYDTAFLKVILPSAEVNHKGGHALSLAIKNSLPHHAQLLLAKKPNGPNSKTFDNAFDTAMDHKERSEQLRYCRMLLVASPAGNSASAALLKAVQAGNGDLCNLMLQYKASPNFEGGLAVVAAVNAENVVILTSLVQNSNPRLSEQSLKAGLEAALALGNIERKLEVAKIILDAGLRGDAVHSALVTESQGGDKNLEMCSLLLRYGASLDYQRGEALGTATNLGAVALMRAMLLEGLCSDKPSEESLSRAFISSRSHDRQIRPAVMELILQAGLRTSRTQEIVDTALLKLVQEPSTDLASIKVLLKYGASVHYSNHQALISVATNANPTLLTLLLQYVKDSSATSTVFEERIGADGFWKTKSGLDIMELLLQNGAEGEHVDWALILAVTDSENEALAARFVTLLLQWKADVNYRGGKALQIAAAKGDFGVLSKLVTGRPTPGSILMAFSFLFSSEADEPNLLSLMQLLLVQLGNTSPKSFVHPEIPKPVVFLSIGRYPQSHLVLAAVLEAGFFVDDKMDHELGDEYGNEKVTALFWALCLPVGTVTEPVIETLIEYGAAVNGHPQPLLHLAIAKKYSRVVQRLIEAGVDVDVTGPDGTTPLTLASRTGDLLSMNALLGANAEVNDGSLHDAAHNLDSQAIQLLINHGHDPNIPSPRHQGRSPLAELCYQAPFFKPQASSTEMKRAIKALVNNGANTDVKTATSHDFEKSLLLLALDSAKPHLMAEAFLHCDQWKYINEDFNLFTNGEYTFSPIMYVEKGVWRGHTAHRKNVLNVLKTYKSGRRFWKNVGEQPADMVGAPDNIVQAENRRRAEMEETQRLQRALDQKLHLQEQEKQAAIAMMEREHAVVRRLEQDRHNTEFAALQARLNADLAYKQQQANIENQRTAQRNAQQLENMRAQKAIEYKSFSDRKAIEHRERDHTMELMRTEKGLVESRNKLGRTAIEAAKMEMQYKQAGLGRGSSTRAALTDVSGPRRNLYLENGSAS